MRSLFALEPIDYLVIGHLACDTSPTGNRLGGTAAYAALTAQAIGLRVGIVSSWGSDIALADLGDIPVLGLKGDRSTCFENIGTDAGRQQILHHAADNLDYYLVPESWRGTSIVHLGPIAQEVAPNIIRRFPNSMLGITPQGWLRDWDLTGKVRHKFSFCQTNISRTSSVPIM